MSLAPLLKYPPVVWLTPRSGIQFLDLGFRLAGDRERVSQWSFYDGPDMPAPRIVGRGGEAARGRVSYEVDWRGVLETFGRVWVPVPFFRREQAGGHADGPINWARAQVIALDQPDDLGNDHRLVLAFDTNLGEHHADMAYLAPTNEDTQRGAQFGFAANEQAVLWYAGRDWIGQWCRKAFTEMILAEERKRSRAEPVIDAAMINERLAGPREDVARYVALLDFIGALKITPNLGLIDRVSKPRATPIDVDLVLDLGNSRTCGLLIETHPDETSVDLAQAVRLSLRDLGMPERLYSDPFDSRIEFNKAAIGWDDISFLSGRADAFGWPTVARVGVEAQRLAALRRGSEGATGMSSPKRYLWDETQRRDGWRFNTPGLVGASPFAMGVEFTTLVNDAGEPLHSVPEGVPINDDARFPSIRALYARSHLMTFSLAEILLQALCMMNAPAHRLRRGNADLPRRLRRVILTVPTGMPQAERQILEQRAQAARDLIYICLGLGEVVSDGEDATQKVRATEDDHPLPGVIIKWDEASATQAAYLYSQVAIAYGGDAKACFARLRRPGRPSPDEAIRLATLDIGGGTTDLVITGYRVDGHGANVTLFPKQILTEGISLAGDDVVKAIIAEHVLGPIRAALSLRASEEAVKSVMARMFGGNRGDMDVEEQLRRQQFAAHIGYPLALRMIVAYEGWDRLSGDNRRDPLVLKDVVGEVIDRSLVARVDEDFRRHGFTDFSLRDLRFEIDLKDIDRTTRSVLTDMLRGFAELVHRNEADVLILSGRPSRMPAVRDILTETCGLPPHRIVPLHEFRVGQWYPFRDHEAHIADPKTTAAVGAMICVLGEGRLRNFNFRADHLVPRSTARFFGKLDSNNKLADQDVFYSDLDFDDPDYELPQQTFEFRTPMSLGTRQFAVDWWSGTRLYSIDYASPEVAESLNKRTPLKVELQRVQGRGGKGVIDALKIRRVEDAEGRSLASNQIRLWLQTIENQDGYWLDTGILQEN
ncbi:virulence factor SrfB [Rhodospirillum rubrum]|uniref:Virulence factor SrfB n=1 Tax=Rhodospirillum rubrum (strain ATCC 11170 / ATH 1.1.1 / DSM 467 / LMG 4362 / NCIMB 8255 / S1) TaxID=269796 RepID=Q2RPJ6_RHORT|nr:virulence factor SrfB [Rhodospirillum rubrum]ABC23949.1 conserved hypothetical protein [Rhodospirillum rubrum ATCC 11170]AEO49694.1 hypothetical protein F11_16160 [Rhodospirillum rubrum F11]MBK5955609.1 hypothetical protein [Rhodospirillum rubrum]QXG79892.1 virulence factor SrfB [Rhodospirillum rubrum]HAQ00906.1 hypothetical protein [Rhodospirillum rubrum]